jgi:WD40 repeat protein
VLYELLTGRPPFEGKDNYDIINQVRHTEPVRPRARKRSLPRDLESICLKCLHKVPEKRYATAEAVADDLERFLAGRPTKANPVSSAERFLKWVKRRPAVAALTALTVVLAVVGAAMFYDQSRRTDEERKKAEGLLYGSRIDKAERYVSDGYPDLAEELLQECPDRFRDLEWYFLRRCVAGRVDPLRGHRREVQSVACVPGGRTLISGDSGGDILCWPAADPLHSFPLQRGAGASEWVTRLGYSGDGRFCFAALKNMNVKVWEVALRRPPREFPGAGYPAALDREGKLLATAGRSKEITVWDVATGVVRHRFQHGGSVNGLAFSADGRWLASSGYADEYHVRLWDLSNPRGKPRELHPSNNKVWTNDVAFHPKKNNVLAVVQGSTVCLWDLDSGVEERLQRGELERCNSIAFSADGRYLAATYITGVLTVWDVELHKTVFSARRSRKELLSSVAFVQDGEGREVVYTRGAEILVERWRETGSQETQTFSFKALVQGLAFNPATGALACGSADGGVRSWDPATGREVFQGPFAGQKFAGMAFAPDGQSLAVTTGDRKIHLLDARTGQILATLPGHGDVVTAVCFDPQGKRLASTSADRTFTVWDLAGRAAVLSRTLPEPLLSVAYHPDGERLAVGGNDGLLQVWDLRTGDLTLTCEGHEHNVGNLSFSRDGRLLASAGTDALVILWDATTGREIRRLSGHTGTVTAVAFSPKGPRLVSAGMDNTLKIWNTHNGQMLLSLNGQYGVTGLAIREDGNVIASAHLDRKVRLWDGTPP